MNRQEVDNAIRQTAGGDLDALKMLYVEFEQPVYRMAFGITGNKQLAEDIMQNTFVKAYEVAATYRPRGKGKEWLLGIARNLSKQQLTKEGRYALREDPHPLDVYMEERVEQRLQAQELLGVLNSKEQEIVTLHVLGEMKLKDIAALLHLPLGSVYWSFSNARHKMLRHLQMQKEPTAYAGTKTVQ